MSYRAVIELAIDKTGGETELSKELGVSRQVVNYWLHASTFPHKYRKQISDLIGVSESDIDGWILIEKGIKSIKEAGRYINEKDIKEHLKERFDI